MGDACAVDTRAVVRSATQGMAQADLAGLLGVGKVAISRMIDRLAASGLVERRPDSEDRR